MMAKAYFKSPPNPAEIRFNGVDRDTLQVLQLLSLLRFRYVRQFYCRAAPHNTEGRTKFANLGVCQGWSDTLVTVSAPWEKVD